MADRTFNDVRENWNMPTSLRQSSPFQQIFGFAGRILLILFAALAFFSILGCTVTTAGMESKETIVEDVFPPSRVVASYRRLNKPKQLPRGAERRKAWGDERAVEILSQWNALSHHYCDYGLPNQLPRARLVIAEFSDKENAYGAFTALRSDNLPVEAHVKIGVQGVFLSERLFFTQNRYLAAVTDLAPDQSDERRSVLIEFGLRISDRLPHDITDIAPITRMPLENRVPGSEKFWREAPAPLKVADRELAAARYKVGPREGTFFVADCALGGGAKRVFGRFESAMSKEGPLRAAPFGQKSFSGTFNRQPSIIAIRDGVVFGVYGGLDPKEMVSLMTEADKRIQPLDAEPFKPNEKKSDEEEQKGGYKFGL
jgi:hypothetical protein